MVFSNSEIFRLFYDVRISWKNIDLGIAFFGTPGTAVTTTVTATVTTTVTTTVTYTITTTGCPKKSDP